MSTPEEDLVMFSIRIPRELAEQLGNRAKVNSRSRNKEIIRLLGMAVDMDVQRDLKIQQQMTARNTSGSSGTTPG